MKKIIKTVLAVISIVLIVCNRAYAGDWALQYQTPENDRKEVSLKLPLKVAWQKDYNYSSPLLMDGKLYLVQTRFGFFGRANINLLEIDKKTGDIISSRSIGKVDKIRYCRAIGHNGKIYVSIVYLDWRDLENETLYVSVLAYDPKISSQIWRFDKNFKGRHVSTMDHQGAWLNASKDKIILSIMDMREHDKIFCLDADNGKTLWSANPSGYINNTLPPISGDKVFVVTNGKESYLRVYNINSGDLAWERELLWSSAGAGGKTKELSPQMQYDVSVLCKEGVVYMPLSIGNRGLVYFLQEQDGSGGVVFGGDKTYFFDSTPLVDERAMYISEIEENILCIGKSHKEIWRKSIKNINIDLYVQTINLIGYTCRQRDANYFVFISKEDGHEVDRYNLTPENALEKQTLIYGVMVEDGFVLVCQSDGTYFALKSSD
jgi:outer membrane protein assembly factor BamB